MTVPPSTCFVTGWNGSESVVGLRTHAADRPRADVFSSEQTDADAG